MSYVVKVFNGRRSQVADGYLGQRGHLDLG